MTKLYRIENPRNEANYHPDGITSHDDIVGGWFSPDLDYVTGYARKATQTFGRGSEVVDGARLVVADIPDDQVVRFEAARHPVASEMDIEPHNYILPRDGSVSMTEIALDGVLGELRGRLGPVWRAARSAS